MELKRKVIITSLVIFMSSCAVGPNDKYGRATVATEDGKICKKQKVVGSQIPTRVCGTPKTMALLEARSQDLMKRMSRKPNFQKSSEH
jgi:hypothetical protein